MKNNRKLFQIIELIHYKQLNKHDIFNIWYSGTCRVVNITQVPDGY